MKSTKIIIYLSLAVWIVLAAIFAFYDLEISKQIVNRTSGWAIFLENFGMIPGIFIILSGIYLYQSNIKWRSDAWSYTKKIIFFLTSTGLILYLFDIVLGNLFSENFVINNLITFLIISFLISIAIFIIIQIRKTVENKLLIIYSKIVIGLALFGYVICIQGVKYIWGRVRFRGLDSAFSQFTPWYLPQGFTGFDSFPSGHAAMGFMLLPLLILIINKHTWVKVFVFCLVLIWGIVLASSRVVVGAHYASDVLFGSFFIIITFLLLSHYHVNNFKKTSTK